MPQSVFDRLLYTMQAGFDQIDAHFDQIDAHFDQIDARFDQIDARMDACEARLDVSFNKPLQIAVGIILTGIAITTAIIVALFIHYLG